MGGNEPACGVPVFGEVVLRPEVRHEAVSRPPSQSLVPLSRTVAREYAIQRCHAAKGIDGMTLRHAVGGDAHRTLNIVARTFDQTAGVGQRRQIIRRQVDSIQIRGEPVAVERMAIDHVRILDERRTGQGRERVSRHPMLVQPAVGIHRRHRRLHADALAGQRRQDGQRQLAVGSLERAHILPVRLDRLHLVQPQQRRAHLVTVQRRIRVAVPESLAIGTHGKIPDEHLRIHGRQDVVAGGVPIGLHKLRIRQVGNVDRRHLGSRLPRPCHVNAYRHDEQGEHKNGRAETVHECA